MGTGLVPVPQDLPPTGFHGPQPRQATRWAEAPVAGPCPSPGVLTHRGDNAGNRQEQWCRREAWRRGPGAPQPPSWAAAAAGIPPGRSVRPARPLPAAPLAALSISELVSAVVGATLGVLGGGCTAPALGSPFPGRPCFGACRELGMGTARGDPSLSRVLYLQRDLCRDLPLPFTGSP